MAARHKYIVFLCAPWSIWWVAVKHRRLDSRWVLGLIQQGSYVLIEHCVNAPFLTWGQQHNIGSSQLTSWFRCGGLSGSQNRWNSIIESVHKARLCLYKCQESHPKVRFLNWGLPLHMHYYTEKECRISVWDYYTLITAAEIPPYNREHYQLPSSHDCY